MADSAAGGAAFLNGEEIVNDARTLAYLEAGYGPPKMTVDGGCACCRIQELIECGSDPYTSPASDPAPWYDSSVPESADFAGFLTTEFEGLGSTYTRESIEKVTGGATLGRLKAEPRTLTWKGYLFGRTDCAVQFGLNWMTANLKGTGCVCGGEDLDLMVCCPELTETPPDSGCRALPPTSRPALCPPYTQPDAFRTLKSVGLLEGPTILSQRKIGCTGCNEPSCAGDTVITEIEFSLLAGTPYLYGCPVCLCVDQPFPEPDLAVCPTTWYKLTSEELAVHAITGELPAICGEESCPEEADCTLDEGCGRLELPFIPPFEDQCFCAPIDAVQVCCPVPADSFGQFFEGAPIIEIFSGASAMRGTTIRFFANPQDLPCCDAAANPCLNCDSLYIRYIPAFSTMTIDGTTRQVTVQCPGMGQPVLADHLTVTPFAWPTLSCVDFCVCVETEGADNTVSSEATVTVLVVPREM